MRWFMLLLLLLWPAAVMAQPAKAPNPNAEGEALIMGYFKQQVKEIASNCLTDLGSRDSWEKNRPEKRRQFLEMMGLWPMPPRTDLKATVTGTVEGDGFIVEKLHFQSRPGLYVTGNLYRPKNPPAQKLPAILYVCGHGNVVLDGVSYGSKMHYQYHPAWFAKHGYICLILDTLQLGEIQGLHHGTYREGMWWWQTRGYTPGGVELWNGIRALDYLESRPDVDASKLGLTGRSGGGASSWWIAAADERVKAVVPVAGIADLQAHLTEGPTDRLKLGVIAGHCDCMFMVNKYRWDFADVASLIAPRPLLLGNSDNDDIFPVPGYRRIAEKVQKVYELYGAGDKFQLLETKGPHTDTPELRIGINRWMNRWLKGDTTTKVEDDLPPKLTPQQLKVFKQIPLDSVNEQVHEVFTPEQDLKLPDDDREIRTMWATKRTELLKRLERDVFTGWSQTPPDLQVKLVGEEVANGFRVQAVEYLSETAMPLKLWIFSYEDQDKAIPKEVQFEVWDLNRMLSFGLFMSEKQIELIDPKLVSKAKSKREQFGRDFPRPGKSGGMPIRVVIAPRGQGPTQWAEPGSSFDIQVKRRFALIGQTLDGQRVWDVRRGMAAAMKYLKMNPATAVNSLSGEGSGADLALYASLFEPSVKQLRLTSPSPSLRTGPTLLNAAKVLDNPWAVALALNPQRSVSVTGRDPEDWTIPKAIAKATQAGQLSIRGLAPPR